MFLVHPQNGLNGLILNWWLLVHSSPGNITGPVTTRLRQAGPENSDDVAVSRVSKRPAPLWAAFPNIAAFNTAMPTILLPTAVLFVCIYSRATSERCTNLSDNVTSERLPRSRQHFFYLFFSVFLCRNSGEI